MMFSLFLATGLSQTTNQDLNRLCPNGYNVWNKVDESNWYEGTDWESLIANGDATAGINGDANSATNVYPMGFQNFELAHYNEPPICIRVDTARNKKVEILLESPTENANLCIHDVSYDGVGLNNAGSVDNCGTGKIYACFTAAVVTGQPFGFYVSCENGCEDMSTDVWIRVRVSDQSWDAGKTGVADDLEHWCEGERGHHMDSDDYESTLYYTYPSDLIPDEPSVWPFHIKYILGDSAGSYTAPTCAVTLATMGIAYMLA